MKKLLALTSTILIALSLVACKSNQNNAQAKPETKPFTVTQQSLVKTFTVDYANTDSDSSTSNKIDSLTNNYLKSIKNINDYNVELRTNAVQNNINFKSESIEVYTLLLTKK